MTIVDIYCRVSTEDQEDNTSLDEQEACGRQYCAEHGLTVGMVHRETFTGWLYREREKLTLMRERYLSGQIQGVVFRTYDRLGRKEVHLGILLEEMEHEGIQIHCVKETLDDSLLGRMTRIFLSLLAEWEWEKIRERTTTGRINRAKEGKIVAGRKLPYGWKWQLNDKGEKERVVHELTQLWRVRWMALKFVRGTSTMDIAKQLTERGIPTPEHNGSWHPNTVRRILSNERLTGRSRNFAYQVHRAKQPFEPIDLPDGTYPAIVSQELYDDIQVRLQRNKDESPRHNERPEDFLVRAGYIRRALCQRPMIAHIDRRRRKNHPPDKDVDRLVYRCNGYDRLGNVVCDGQDVLSKLVDAWVWQELQKLADHTDLIQQAIALATSANSLQADAKAIDASLALWEKKAQNYLEDLEDPTLHRDTRASIRQSLNIANQHIEQLKTEQAQVLLGMIDRDRERQAYQDILAWCQTVKEARGELSYQRKRDFLHMLGLVVIVKGEDGIPSCRIEIMLPDIQALLSSTVAIGECSSLRMDE